MRARKRNPYWGQGLDKRQARRARRHANRRAARAPVGVALEHSIQDPFTGDITVRVSL